MAIRLRGIVGSAVLHASIIGATLVAWSHTRDLSDEPSQVIPVEMVDIADVTNIRPQAREEPKPVEEPLPEATPAPEPTPQAEAPPAEEAPPPPPDETAEADEPVPPPPPVQKPHPPKPTAAFDPDRILALLDKRAPRTAPPAPAPRGERTVRGIGNQDALTMDIQAALLEQMRECWNFPVGAPNPEQLIVQVEVFLTRDGHVMNAVLSDDSRAAEAHNPYMRPANEAALRAIKVCEPYRLPPDRYNVWRDIVMTFDPSKMVGR